MKRAREVMERAGSIVGLSPVPLWYVYEKFVHDPAVDGEDVRAAMDEVLKEGEDPNKNGRIRYGMEQAVREFLRDELRMDTEDVDQLNIKQVFVPVKTREVLYIKLPSRREVDLIYRASKYMNPDSVLGRPSLVRYIPPQAYPRYAWLNRYFRSKIPEGSKLNISVGQTDFEVKYRDERDSTPWARIPPQQIPGECPSIISNYYTKSTKINIEGQRASGRKPLYTRDNSNQTLQSLCKKSAPPQPLAKIAQKVTQKSGSGSCTGSESGSGHALTSPSDGHGSELSIRTPTRTSQADTMMRNSAGKNTFGTMESIFDTADVTAKLGTGSSTPEHHVDTSAQNGENCTLLPPKTPPQVPPKNTQHPNLSRKGDKNSQKLAPLTEPLGTGTTGNTETGTAVPVSPSGTNVGNLVQQFEAQTEAHDEIAQVSTPKEQNMSQRKGSISRLQPPRLTKKP